MLLLICMLICLYVFPNDVLMSGICTFCPRKVHQLRKHNGAMCTYKHRVLFSWNRSKPISCFHLDLWICRVAKCILKAPISVKTWLCCSSERRCLLYDSGAHEAGTFRLKWFHHWLSCQTYLLPHLPTVIDPSSDEPGMLTVAWGLVCVIMRWSFSKSKSLTKRSPSLTGLRDYSELDLTYHLRAIKSCLF